jgi:cell division protein FtsN
MLTDHDYRLMATPFGNRLLAGPAFVLVVLGVLFFMMGYVVSRADQKNRYAGAQVGQAKGSTAAPPSNVTDSRSTDPAPHHGKYLQVAAIDRPGATALAEAYRKLHFPVIISESSSPRIFRVLIGPFESDDQIVAAKARLKAIGVTTPVLRTL